MNGATLRVCPDNASTTSIGAQMVRACMLPGAVLQAMDIHRGDQGICISNCMHQSRGMAMGMHQLPTPAPHLPPKRPFLFTTLSASSIYIHASPSPHFPLADPVSLACAVQGCRACQDWKGSCGALLICFGRARTMWRRMASFLPRGRGRKTSVSSAAIWLSLVCKDPVCVHAHSASVSLYHGTTDLHTIMHIHANSLCMQEPNDA